MRRAKVAIAEAGAVLAELFFEHHVLLYAAMDPLNLDALRRLCDG